VREVRVPFARPRREEMKTEPAFLELRREIWQILKRGAGIEAPRAKESE
jgi:NitT/TauT family transport system ATP-binding protein